MAEFVVKAEVDNLDQVFDFIHEQLDAVDCPPKAMMQIDLAVDEIFANISNYAYNLLPLPRKGSRTMPFVMVLFLMG